MRWSYIRMFFMYSQKKKRFIVIVTVKAIETNHTTGGKSVYSN